jgi:gliding motility-associated transport system ATP-binding protein
MLRMARLGPSGFDSRENDHPDRPDMIEAVALSRRFGPVHAVKDVTFAVARGEVAAFLGPNGAGKTTCMRILTGFLPPTRGRAVVAEHDVSQDPRAVRRVLGYLPENVPIYGDMRVREYLDFRARLKGVSRRERKTRIPSVMERCGLTAMRNRLVGHLSKGYRQRVGLADALVGDPSVLILDEPTVGLDPNQTVEVRQLIQDLGAERTVLLSTHILSEAEAISTQIIIIHEGRILVTDTPAALRRRVRAHHPIRLEIIGDNRATMKTALESVPGVRQASLHENTGQAEGWCCFTVHHRAEADPREALFELIKARNWHLRDLHQEELSLEQIFRVLTGAQASGEASADEADKEERRDHA